VSWKTLLEMGIFRVETRLADSPGGPHPVARLVTADWVNVVALTTEGQVVLVRQHRFGIEEEAVEIPGGIVDPGEAPLQAAVRELREETGYGGGRWSDLGFVHPNPAIQTNRTFLFLAEGVVLEGPQEPDPTEAITVELAPAAAIPGLLAAGRITHALAVVGLQRWLLRGAAGG
jgi:ADP-ribose pyrophosphatase